MKLEGLHIGCIGCGNMGGAIMGGFAKTSPCTLWGYDPNIQCQNALKSVGISIFDNPVDLAHHCQVIIIGVKPHLVEKVLTDLQPTLTQDSVVLSIAAGISLATMQSAVKNVCPVIRCMPNTPALVGDGVFAFCFEDETLRSEQKSIIMDLFKNIGLCLELPEKQFTAFSAFMGAGPAYVFHFMNALVQAGVTLGFSRAESKHMVDALVTGSAKMSSLSEHNLPHLRDQVCSPAGLTIAGVNHLERTAVGGHIVDAILEAEKRGKAMEK